MVAYTIMNQGQGAPWSMFLFGGVATFLIIQLHGLGLGTKARLAIAAPLLLVMGGFYASAPENIVNAPRLTISMTAATEAEVVQAMARQVRPAISSG